MNILMIEDDRELCSTVSFRLEQEGFSVTLCHDGEEGLYYMQETPYDLVILDRMLPHMNGIEILKEARSRQIKTPFIILTALGELNDRLTGLNCGADDYMVKPFAFEELLARIRCLLRRPAAYNPAADAVSLGDVTFIPETRRLSSGKKDCTFPAGRETIWKYFSAIPDRHFPASFFLQESGDLTQMWRKETLTIIFIFCAGG